MTDPRPQWLRWVARATLHGPDAPYVLADLEEGFARDRANGRSPSSARRRYLTNAIKSAFLLLVTGRAFGLGASWLDVKAWPFAPRRRRNSRLPTKTLGPNRG